MIRRTSGIVLSLLLLSGCGSGGSSSTAEAPCDLLYSSAVVVLTVGESLIPLVPTTGCGVASDWAVDPALPAGLSISPADGTISGIPTTSTAATDYIITASNVTGSTTFTINILINPEGPCDLQYSSSALVLTVGEVLTPLVPTTGCGVVSDWAVAPALPTGLSISPADGTISGTPTLATAATDHIITASSAFGSTTFTINILINPQAPCNLTYAVDFVIVPANVSLTPLSPSVNCGPVALWQITPPLPTGIQIDASSGVISGMATEEGYDATHTITASNVSGSTAFDLRIRIDPVFTYSVSSATGTFSGITGIGQAQVGLSLEEDSGNPTYPTWLAGFNFAMAHDPLLLEASAVTAAPIIQGLNSGTGPTFWTTQLESDEIIVGAIFSFTELTILQFPVETELVSVDYNTVESAFIGVAGPVVTPLTWVEDTPVTNTSNDLLVVADPAQGIVPLAIDGQLTLQRVD